MSGGIANSAVPVSVTTECTLRGSLRCYPGHQKDNDPALLRQPWFYYSADARQGAGVDGCVVFRAQKFGGFGRVDGGDISAAEICPRKTPKGDGEISLIHGLQAEILGRKG